MRSESNGMPGSSGLPSFDNCLPCSSHVSPSCHSSLQLLQKCDVHVGQKTPCGAQGCCGHKEHTVSQPARGHQVRVLSNSTSEKKTY